MNSLESLSYEATNKVDGEWKPFVPSEKGKEIKDMAETILNQLDEDLEFGEWQKRYGQLRGFVDPIKARYSNHIDSLKASQRLRETIRRSREWIQHNPQDRAQALEMDIEEADQWLLAKTAEQNQLTGHNEPVLARDIWDRCHSLQRKYEEMIAIKQDNSTLLPINVHTGVKAPVQENVTARNESEPVHFEL